MKRIIAALASSLLLSHAQDTLCSVDLCSEAIVSDYGDIRFENANEKQTEDK